MISSSGYIPPIMLLISDLLAWIICFPLVLCVVTLELGLLQRFDARLLPGAGSQVDLDKVVEVCLILVLIAIPLRW